MRTSIPAGGGVPALVQRRRQNDQAEHDEEEHRLIDQVAEALCDAVHEKQPPVEGDETGQRNDDDERPEERSKQGGDGVDQRRWDDRRFEVESQ